MLCYAISPQSLQLALLDRTLFGKVLHQRVQHGVVIKSGRRLAVQQVQQYVELFVGPLKRGFQRTDPLQEMFFHRGLQQALSPAIGSRGRSVAHYHQARATGGTAFTVIWIRMSASLTENHVYKTTPVYIKRFGQLDYQITNHQITRSPIYQYS